MDGHPTRARARNLRVSGNKSYAVYKEGSSRKERIKESQIQLKPKLSLVCSFEFFFAFSVATLSSSGQEHRSVEPLLTELGLAA
jgi:hypothetical protein